jgi:hypothetical protein
MQSVRLLVFGAPWDATRTDAASDWTLSKATGDGKRVPVDLQVPAMIGADEIATYVADLLHEAVPAQGDDRVLRLPDALNAPNAPDAPEASAAQKAPDTPDASSRQ